MKPIRVFTAFSGYDSQCMALDRIGVPYELIGWSEIDKYAIKAHNAVYPQYADGNHGDITQIDWDSVPNFDLFTYSFPCQSVSAAGLQKGFEEGSGTRSSLLWECKKVIAAKKPKYLLMENVKNLVSEKFMPGFRKWEQWLASQGYANYCKVLNAVDYGVPQNRERIFVVSILDDEHFYSFPDAHSLTHSLQDLLEENVDEKYYLSEKSVAGFEMHNEKHIEKGTGFLFNPFELGGADTAHTLRANAALAPTDNSLREWQTE